jgi:hypothetical protein
VPSSATGTTSLRSKRSPPAASAGGNGRPPLYSSEFLSCAKHGPGFMEHQHLAPVGL